jgi:uncharacterized protein (TIGR03435 family)
MKNNQDQFDELLRRHLDPTRVPTEKLSEESRLRILNAIVRKKDSSSQVVFSWRRFAVIPTVAAILLAVLIAVTWRQDAFAVVEKGTLYQIVDGKNQVIGLGKNIPTGTPLRTDGGAVLKLKDGAKIEMRDKSELTLEKANDGTHIRLNNGSVNVTPSAEPVGNLYVQNREVKVAAVFQIAAQAEPRLTFEVASVRRVEIPLTNGRVPVFFPTGGVGTSDPQRIAYHGTWVAALIADAFGVRPDQIIGPDWLTRERYDIDAIIPDGATKEQFNAMLGNLLRDRFHLRFHLESESRPVYALRLAKDGPKFKETARVADDGTAGRGSFAGIDAKGFPILLPNYRGRIGRPVAGEMFSTAQDVSMVDFARSIEQAAGRPVLDETGLKGGYDFKIHFGSVRRPTDAGVPSDPSPTIFTAVEEQLGLKLESTNGTFTQLIIDSIDREPTDN